MRKHIQLMITALLFVVLSLVFSGPCFAQAEVEANLDQLAAQIVAAMDDNLLPSASGEKIRIVVLDFLDLEGNVTSLGRFVAEELTTRLFRTKRFEVIERQLLNKVLDELKLGAAGFVDSGSAQALGNILGASAIVSGTLSALTETVRINARLIATNTGTIFAAASAQIPRDEAIDQLLKKVVTAPEGFIPALDPLPAGSAGGSVPAQPPVTTETGTETGPQRPEVFPFPGGMEKSPSLFNEKASYRNAIEAAVQARDYRQAFSLCREAIAKLPEFAYAYAVLGYTYLNLQPPDRGQAIVVLEKSITLEEYPLENGYTYYLLGRLYLGEGRTAKARVALEKSVLRYRQVTAGGQRESWYEEAVRIGSKLYQDEIEACWQRADYGTALALSRQAITSFNSAYAYVAQGYSLLQLGRENAPEAISLFRQALELADYPAGDGWTHYLLGWAYWETGEKAAAEGAFVQAIQRSRQQYLFQKPEWMADCLRYLRQIYNERTTYFLEKKEYKQAIRFLEEATRLDEEFAFGYVVLGYCYLQTGEPVQRALVVLQKAFNLEEYPAGDGWANYVLGWALKEKGETILAKESLTKALQQAEKSGIRREQKEWVNAAFTLLRQCYEHLFDDYKLYGGKAAEYRVLVEECTGYFPDFAYAYAVKGHLLMQGAPPDTQGAIAALQSALALAEYPAGDGWTYYALGWAYHEQGENKQALQYLEKALNRCREVKRYPSSVRWYQQCDSLWRQLMKRSTVTLGASLDLAAIQYGYEPSWRIELGSGQGIPFKYYQGTKFRFGFTPEIFQAEIGGELVWEGEASPQSMLGWYGLLGGGGYGTFYTWDDQGRVELGWYLTLGGGARLYLHRASGLCLTLGSELQFNFGARERLSLTAALSIPSF